MSEDLDLLQGDWAVTTLEVEARNAARDACEHRHVIKGSRFTSTGMGCV